MNAEQQRKILDLLDLERQNIVFPGVTRYFGNGVVRDLSEYGRNCEIVYSSCFESEVDQMIKQEAETARESGYTLEWKVYSHDQPQCLGERLVSAGFEADAEEAFMVFYSDKKSINNFGVVDQDIRKVTDRNGLEEYRTIIEEVREKKCDKEIDQFASMLHNYPNNMSIYIAYVNGEPAACGRVYFHEDSSFAGLYGGNTRKRFRNRGLFTQLVAVRIQETERRGIGIISVDALPTSESILRKRGFEIVTHTQPFSLLL